MHLTYENYLIRSLPVINTHNLNYLPFLSQPTPTNIPTPYQTTHQQHPNSHFPVTTHSSKENLHVVSGWSRVRLFWEFGCCIYKPPKKCYSILSFFYYYFSNCFNIQFYRIVTTRVNIFNHKK